MNLDSEIITLEDYKLPLYDGKAVIEDKTIIDDLCKKLLALMVLYFVDLNIMEGLLRY